MIDAMTQLSVRGLRVPEDGAGRGHSANSST
jgi:hypothetical protein